MSPEQVKEDILAGTRDAADRGKISELDPDELDQLFEIFADTNRIVAVKPGEEVITTDDGAANSLPGGWRRCPSDELYAIDFGL